MEDVEGDVLKNVVFFFFFYNFKLHKSILKKISVNILSIRELHDRFAWGKHTL